MPHPLPPARVVLAAGASRRLGTCKALCLLGSATALELLLAAARSSDAAQGAPREPTLVVTGKDHAPIAAALARAGLAGEVELVPNPRWEEGRTGGLALAAALRGDRDLCVAPVDVPCVGAAVFAALDRAWRAAAEPARGWLAPCVERAGRRAHGHPIVLGRALALELAGLAPDTPLQALRERADPLLEVLVAEAAILDDLDRPHDLARLRRRLAGG